MAGAERRPLLQGALLALLVALDQITKLRIESADFRPFVVVDGWLNVVRAHNTGVAFSLFDDLPAQWRAGVLVGATLIIAAFIAWWWWRERRGEGALSWILVLILAGAIGNIIDRARLGYVVDFVDAYVRVGGEEYHWPAFNVADSCISVGVVLLLIVSLRPDR